MIARAAEGSARDALSLLDQAIAMARRIGGGAIAAEDLRQMLGVADKARVIELFEAVMAGEIAEALAILEDQYNGGADPRAGAAGTGRIHPSRDAPEGRARDGAIVRADAGRANGAARRRRAACRSPTLTRAWQILLKGRRGAARRAAAAGGGRHGAGPARLCRRPADAGRGAAEIGFGSAPAPVERRASAAPRLAGPAPRRGECVGRARPAPSRRRASAARSAGASVAPPRRESP